MPVAHVDHKDKKSTRVMAIAEKEICVCNSLTNEMIKQILLDSPLKSVVE